MQVILLQFVLVLFALFAFSRTLLRFKEGRLSRHEFIFWSAVWTALIVAAALPSVISGLATFFGVETAVNFIMIPSIAVLAYLIFRIYVRLENQQEEITKLTQLLALKKKK